MKVILTFLVNKILSIYMTRKIKRSINKTKKGGGVYKKSNKTPKKNQL